MNRTPTNKRPPHNSSASRILVTATAVAATVAGWGLLSQKTSADTQTPATQAVVQVVAQPSQVVLNLPAIPTVVPRPAGLTAYAQPVPGNQAPAAQPAIPVLRSVNTAAQQQPAPVTTTRTSR